MKKTFSFFLILVCSTGIIFADTISVAQALSIGAALANNTSTETQYTIRGYVSAINVKNSDAYSEQYGNQSFYITDDSTSTASSNADGAFYVYRGVPSTGTEIPEGAYVELTNTIRKYVSVGGGNAIIENTDQNVLVTVLSLPKSIPDTISVSQAVAIALALPNNGRSLNKYAIVGYVTRIMTEYNKKYINFSMSDDASSKNGDFRYHGLISEEEGVALKQGDAVLVCGNLLNNYYNDANSAQTYHGSSVNILPSMNIISLPQEGGRSENKILTASQRQISAIPYEGYHFVKWTDGNMDNPRNVLVTRDTTFIAEFARNTYSITTAPSNPEFGQTTGDTAALYLDQVEICAKPNYGYHFSQWSDGNKENPRFVVLTTDIELIAEFAPNQYAINDASNRNHGYIMGSGRYDYLSECQLKAIPARGFYFIRWADGNTDNPRTIELTQDTTMEAIFDYQLTGKCGQDSVLTWSLDTTTMALNITGKGALSENFTYGTFIEYLTIGNEITSLGYKAFSGLSKLKSAILGYSVKVLEEKAFQSCSAIETITCYSQRPPTVNQNALYGIDYSTVVYVPADYLNNYVMHDAWGLYDVRPLGATSAETSDIQVTPTENTAVVVWPAIPDAVTYELIIKDKNGDIICTLVFNANGQLTQIAFNAPARDNAPQQKQGTGFAFTVTGLESGTGYDLTITAKDNNGATINSESISFTTAGEQSIENINDGTIDIHKIVNSGQIFILRGDRTYTVTGQEIR